MVSRASGQLATTWELSHSSGPRSSSEIARAPRPFPRAREEPTSPLPASDSSCALGLGRLAVSEGLLHSVSVTDDRDAPPDSSWAPLSPRLG